MAIVLGQWWQAQLRDLMGAPTPNLLLLVLLPLALVTTAHALREKYARHRRIARWTAVAERP